MEKNEYFQMMDKDESILYQCRVGKRMIVLFVILGIIIFVLAAAFVPLMILAFKNIPSMQTYILLPLVLLILVFSSIYCELYSKNLKNRTYVLTNKRILFSKGGALGSAHRMVELKNIYGLEKRQNFIHRMLGVCNIDFFSPSISMRSRTFLKIFSLSSSPFCFVGVKTEDADMMMVLTLKNK